jgi:hypothetical protein
MPFIPSLKRQGFSGIGYNFPDLFITELWNHSTGKRDVCKVFNGVKKRRDKTFGGFRAVEGI